MRRANFGTLTARSGSDWLASAPRRLAIVQRAGGFAMIGLGLSVAATGRKE